MRNLVMEAKADDGAGDLHGARILVVEDDPLLLMELESILLDAGAEIVGLCRSVAEALPLVDGGRLDAAILDFGLGRETAAPVADRLAQTGTPFCFYTGQVTSDVRLAPWEDHVIIQKPAPPQMIVRAVATLVNG